MNPVIVLKMRQTRKIAEIGEALRAAGILSLNAQAAVLGLPRSTTYTVVCAEHKSTGLSAKIISQTLRSPRLPLPVRTKIEEYAKEKASGLYGSTNRQQRHSCCGSRRPPDGQRRRVDT